MAYRSWTARLGGLKASVDRMELLKTMSMAISSARYKMPLKVTPLSLWLTRSEAVVNPTTGTKRREPKPKNWIVKRCYVSPEFFTDAHGRIVEDGGPEWKRQAILPYFAALCFLGNTRERPIWRS